MNFVIITQARFGSSRLRGKVLKKIGNHTLLDIHLDRLKRSQLAQGVIVATTKESEAAEILEVAKRQGCLYYQGSLSDVLDRYYQASGLVSADVVIRVTSDCPLIDWRVIDEMIQLFKQSNVDYLSNVHPPTYPDGIDIEIFSMKSLKKAWQEATLEKDREHVTPYIWGNEDIFKKSNHRNSSDMSQYRLTVDNQEDYELVSHLVEKLGSDRPWEEYINYLKINSDINMINQRFKRNEGF